MASYGLLGRVTITGWASLLVKNHSVVCCISLYKRFLPNLGSYPRWCANGFGDRRQENVPPVSKGCFIMLPKSDVLRARHRLNWDAASKTESTANLRQEFYNPKHGRSDTTLDGIQGGNVCVLRSRQGTASKNWNLSERGIQEARANLDGGSREVSASKTGS
jgi:hypothetical protein